MVYIFFGIIYTILKKQLFLFKNKSFIKIKINNDCMHELTFINLVKFFLENPYEEFYLRELAKKLKLSPFAVKKYCDILVKEDIIKDEKKAKLRFFHANVSNIFFRQLKISFNINVILKSGLLDLLKENITNISSIVLFGSMAKGEDSKESDVDILVIGKEKYLDLEKIEEKLDKKINLHILSWSEWSKNAENNKAFYFDIIIYGMSLYGELPLVKWK